VSTKLFSENRTLQAAIAIVLAFMSLFSDIVVETINTAAPWFVLLVIFIIFIMLGFMILGVKEADFMSVLKNPEYSFVSWWIIGLVVIIVVGSMSHVIAQQKGGYGPYIDENETVEGAEGRPIEETQEADFWKTLFHPKVLGLFVLLLIGFFTVSKLTSTK
jgi:hypothetical protein